MLKSMTLFAVLCLVVCSSAIASPPVQQKDPPFGGDGGGSSCLECAVLWSSGSPSPMDAYCIDSSIAYSDYYAYANCTSYNSPTTHFCIMSGPSCGYTPSLVITTAENDEKAFGIVEAMLRLHLAPLGELAGKIGDIEERVAGLPDPSSVRVKELRALFTAMTGTALGDGAVVVVPVPAAPALRKTTSRPAPHVGGPL
jgi:hypothetical protein